MEQQEKLDEHKHYLAPSILQSFIKNSTRNNIIQRSFTLRCIHASEADNSKSSTPPPFLPHACTQFFFPGLLKHFLKLKISLHMGEFFGCAFFFENIAVRKNSLLLNKQVFIMLKILITF